MTGGHRRRHDRRARKRPGRKTGRWSGSWTQSGQPLSRCRAPRTWTSGSEPMYLPRVSYTSLVPGFLVAASPPVAVARMIARAIAVLVNMVVSPACAVMHTVLVCARILFVGTRGVNQPDVLTDRSLKRPARCEKALSAAHFWRLAQHAGGGCFGPGTEVFSPQRRAERVEFHENPCGRRPRPDS